MNATFTTEQLGGLWFVYMRLNPVAENDARLARFTIGHGTTRALAHERAAAYLSDLRSDLLLTKHAEETNL